MTEGMAIPLKSVPDCNSCGWRDEVKLLREEVGSVRTDVSDVRGDIKELRALIVTAGGIDLQAGPLKLKGPKNLTPVLAIAAIAVCVAYVAVQFAPTRSTQPSSVQR